MPTLTNAHVRGVYRTADKLVRTSRTQTALAIVHTIHFFFAQRIFTQFYHNLD